MALVLGIAYPLGLFASWALLRFSGESWWLPLVGLYAPPLGFLLPAPIVLAVTWRWAGRGWLALQIVAIVLALFGLLGLNLGLGRDRQAAQDAHALRVLSSNIDSGRRGVPGLVAQIMELQPNLVLLQESNEEFSGELRQAFSGWHTDHNGQFFIASRFPILEISQAQDLYYAKGEGGGRKGRGSARFMRYTIDSPLGPTEIFNIHTTSPREGLDDMRGNGFLHELSHGRVLFGRNADLLTFNAYRRRRQVENMMAEVRASPLPVIIAGDFNLPGLSRVARDSLVGFDDAFERAGRGFGYTYPQRFPFLRIDRIFTGPGLQAVDFRLGEKPVSDHRCIFAVITRRSH